MTAIHRAALASTLLVFGCSEPSAPAPKTPQSGSQKTATDDASACDRICEASEACGDATPECTQKCNAWLVKRSRSGIARQTAACAVPRIERACANDASIGAARALVNCVDDAGRNALRNDNQALVVAVHAICERGARCGGGGQGDATACVDRVVKASPTPRGLGIFGAIRPEIVKDFASCMQKTSCNGSSAACFANMLGEDVVGPEGPSEEPASTAPDTKI
ncbi:MAG: hypothetical protein ACXVEF_17995 [Polyangiales bacterium]